MDFATMFQTWINVLTKPGEEAFQAERGKANLTTALIWVSIAAVIQAVFAGIGIGISSLLGTGSGGMMTMVTQMTDIPPEQAALLGAGAGAGIVSTLFCTLILAPIMFLIGSGIYYVIASMAFGGKGTFEEQSYLLSTFYVPLSIASAVVGIVPFIGGCIPPLIGIYQIVLTYFALKVSHDLDQVKAIIVTLVPVVLFFGCILLSIVASVLWIGSVMAGS